MAKVIDGLFYSESHEYVKVEGEFAYVGITDYAQEQLGNIVYVDMPSEGDEVTAGEEFGAVESVKAAGDLVSPVSGEIVEVNEALEDNSELVNQDAFANWIIKVKLSDPSELDNLMDAEAYRKAIQ
ncbi:MAG: glycine cleavage system protein GcvH [Alloprevotella sp.]|uniref:glycine cleavage system protein GcvH n=1 Tax=Prevotellamassilia timonensis TaxID=1852370 RepID=UPI001D4703C2|nr:glycine cleavage system protein GcvH [Prevotellamassilia timonensis]MBS7396312.1 glycine cleavage system protein GcvH [Prevotellamassilia sp.]MCI5508323.1 glycine cleavage system protein GcvH [Bacteroidales bacterium]MDY2975407.1 glycine cleavage system protein GcvH [Alloprevotella sp.]MCF2635708.1 glycine cleavage system protein GcvH [Prevotellamassilia timonensis]MCI6070118.1 glycine cleavage system protein GcvH [Bacteroidales bacterium]